MIPDAFRKKVEEQISKLPEDEQTRIKIIQGANRIMSGTPSSSSEPVVVSGGSQSDTERVPIKPTPSSSEPVVVSGGSQSDTERVPIKPTPPPPEPVDTTPPKDETFAEDDSIRIDPDKEYMKPSDPFDPGSGMPWVMKPGATRPRLYLDGVVTVGSEVLKQERMQTKEKFEESLEYIQKEKQNIDTSMQYTFESNVPGLWMKGDKPVSGQAYLNYLNKKYEEINDSYSKFLSYSEEHPIQTGVYVEKNDTQFFIPPELGFVMRHAETSERHDIVKAIGKSDKEVETAYVNAYESMTDKEKEIHGVRFTPFINEPVETWKYHPGGSKYLESLPQDKREEILAGYMGGTEWDKYSGSVKGKSQILDVARTEATRLGTHKIEVDIPTVSVPFTDIKLFKGKEVDVEFPWPEGGINLTPREGHYKSAEEIVAWKQLTESDVDASVFESLAPHVKAKRGAGEVGFKTAVWPITLPQTIIKYATGEGPLFTPLWGTPIPVPNLIGRSQKGDTLFLPDVAEEIDKISYSKGQGAIGGTIGWVTTEGKSDFFDQARKHPWETGWYTLAEVTGMYYGGKIAGYGISKLRGGYTHVGTGLVERFPGVNRYLSWKYRPSNVLSSAKSIVKQKAAGFRYGSAHPYYDIKAVASKLSWYGNKYLGRPVYNVRRLVDKLRGRGRFEEKTLKDIYSYPGEYGVDTRIRLGYKYPDYAPQYNPATAEYLLPNKFTRPFERELFLLRDGTEGAGFSFSGVFGRPDPLMTISFAGAEYMPTYPKSNILMYKSDTLGKPVGIYKLGKGYGEFDTTTYGQILHTDTPGIWVGDIATKKGEIITTLKHELTHELHKKWPEKFVHISEKYNIGKLKGLRGEAEYITQELTGKPLSSVYTGYGVKPPGATGVTMGELNWIAYSQQQKTILPMLETGKLPKEFVTPGKDFTYIQLTKYLKNRYGIDISSPYIPYITKAGTPTYTPYTGGSTQNLIIARQLKPRAIPKQWEGIYDVPQGGTTSILQIPTSIKITGILSTPTIHIGTRKTPITFNTNIPTQIPDITKKYEKDTKIDTLLGIKPITYTTTATGQDTYTGSTTKQQQLQKTQPIQKLKYKTKTITTPIPTPTQTTSPKPIKIKPPILLGDEEDEKPQKLKTTDKQFFSIYKFRSKTIKNPLKGVKL